MSQKKDAPPFGTFQTNSLDPEKAFKLTNSPFS